MTSSTFRRALTGVLVLAIMAVVFPSCTKEEPTVARITVKREDGSIVPGAYVKLFANPPYPLGDPNRLTKETNANDSGIAEFDYTDYYEQGQSGFAVMDILCTYDTIVGEGIIKIIEEETAEETVIILPAQ